MDRIRKALLGGPKSVEELVHLKIPRATAYRDLKRMLNTGEVTPMDGRDGEGNVRTLYALAEVTLPASADLVNEALRRLESKVTPVRENAILDLRTICKDHRIVGSNALNKLVSQAKAKPEQMLLEILNFQAIHARKNDDLATINLLRPFVPTAKSIVQNTEMSADERYQALRFLQLTADFETLSDLAVRIVSIPGDPALAPSKPTQFAIVLQSICVKASRLAKYRSRIYDLLLSDDPDIVTIAGQILNLSRQPPIQ